MARIWKELRQRARFGGEQNRIWSPMQRKTYETAKDNLLSEWAYFVYVCGFTFEFWSVEQIKTTLAYCKEPIHPSSRLPQPLPGHHTESQRWFDRLPGELMRENKRIKVVAALQKALRLFVIEDKGVHPRSLSSETG